MSDDLIDIFGDEEQGTFEEAAQNTVVQEETPQKPAIEVVEDTSDDLNLEDDGLNLPKLLEGRDYPQQFLDQVAKLDAQIATYPYVDFEAAYEELIELNVKPANSPTLDILNDEYSKALAIRYRLVELQLEVIKIIRAKKRRIELLRSAWMVFAPGGSKDKREGDTSMVLVEYEIDFVDTETLRDSIMEVLKNVDSIISSYSRRISIFQMQLKVGDMGGRRLTPEINFDTPLNDEQLERSLNGGSKKVPDINLSEMEDDPDIFNSLEDEKQSIEDQEPF